MPENRNTNIPVLHIIPIVQWLINNTSPEEKDFMVELVRDKHRFTLFQSILTKLTDKNIYEVFYENVTSGEELALLRATKRGEVAGLKAFLRVCIQLNEMERKKKGGEKDGK